MIVSAQLAQLVHAFADATGNPPTRVSNWIWGTTDVILALDRGGGVVLDRAAYALQWLSDRWPANEPWPLGIERPPPHPPTDWPPKRGRPRKYPLSSAVA